MRPLNLVDVCSSSKKQRNQNLSPVRDNVEHNYNANKTFFHTPCMSQTIYCEGFFCHFLIFWLTFIFINFLIINLFKSVY